MILITGSTGQLGTAVINHLLKNTSANNIVAFARDADKAKPLSAKGIEVRTGTFDDPASLGAAMQGISQVLLISTIDHNRFQQHRNVVDAAKKAGVKHILYTGVTIRDVSTAATKPIMSSHFETEEYIKQSGLTYTFLRNSLYTEVIQFYVGKNVFETGIHLPAGNGRVAFALRREMGEAAANVLLQKGHENKVYEITGSEASSYYDVANALSTLSGKTVTYTDVEAAGLTGELKAAGTPEQMVFLIVAFATDVRDHQFETVSPDLEHLLGRKPTALKEALKELYHL